MNHSRCFPTARAMVVRTWSCTTNLMQRTSRTWALQKAPYWQCGRDCSRGQSNGPQQLHAICFPRTPTNEHESEVTLSHMHYDQPKRGPCSKGRRNQKAPLDYNEMIFQLKAFVALTEILFGNDSITANKLRTFTQLIESQSIHYKEMGVYGKFFPTRVLWTVYTRFQLYLESCTQAKDREEVNNSHLDFLANLADHCNILLNRFNANLPASFEAVELGTHKDADIEAESEKTTTMKKRKKRDKQENKGAAKKAEFKLKEGELRTQFAGMHLNNRAKMKGTIMCTRWHTNGNCFTNCKNR